MDELTLLYRPGTPGFSTENLKGSLDLDTLQEVVNLDLSCLHVPMKKLHEWPNQRIKQAVADYRQWLSLNLLGSDLCLIPLAADVMIAWSIHIAYGEEYEADCKRIFGAPLPHRMHEYDEKKHHTADGMPEWILDMAEATWRTYQYGFSPHTPGTGTRKVCVQPDRVTGLPYAIWQRIVRVSETEANTVD